MNIDFPEIQKKEYVRVSSRGFTIAGKTSRQLECFIMEISPVRKLFHGRNVECYSNDAVTGRDGQKCAACRKNYKCRPRMRLILSVDHQKQKPLTALLEINGNSFDSLKDMLADIPEDKLRDTLVRITPDSHGKHLKLLFESIF